MSRHRTPGSPAAISLIFLLLLSTANTTGGVPKAHVGIVVPLDTSSPEWWREAISAAPAVGMVVLNPDNGPGPWMDPAASSLVSQAQKAGIKVLGYVATDYDSGSVNLTGAEQQVDRYFLWYQVDGVFFDEASSSCSPSPSSFYLALYTYTKSKDPASTVVLNPGTTPESCYQGEADVLVSFEGTFQQYVPSYPLAPWELSSSGSAFCSIVLGAPDVPAMKQAVDLAVRSNVGWVYVTNETTKSGNPYASLPPYFGDEVAYVESFDSHGSPIQWWVPASLFLGAASVLATIALLQLRSRRAKSETPSRSTAVWCRSPVAQR